jgi:hypothetical protein
MMGITIARAAGGIATKQCRQTSAGPTFTDYPFEKWWWLREVSTPLDARGWAKFLDDRMNDIASCCLYGQPIRPGNILQRRLLHPTDSDPATLREIPRDYLILDFDSAPTPTGLNFIRQPATAIGAVLDRIEELHDCAFAAAISCSAGFKPGIRAKVVVNLDEPMLPSEMRRWANGVNLRFGARVLDPAVLAPAQPIYLAKPIFYGVRDPFPDRVFMRQGREPIAIMAPSEGFVTAGSTGVTAGPSGWRAHLTRLGSLGFHEPLIAAAGAVARNYCGTPAEPIASAIHAIVQEAVLRADPGTRSHQEIVRYASRRFWDEALAHGARREGDRANQIAASVAGIRRT